MATATFPFASVLTTDTDFRVRGKGISDSLAAVGFVKTADTGQINWATVVKPGVNNTQAGYEIWRFNDALQATAPIFIRLGYGIGAGLTVASEWWTIGKGSDGAGNITSVLMSLLQIATGGSQAGTQSGYVSSHDGSSMIILPAAGASGGQTVQVLERSRAADGSATGTGLLFVNQVSSPSVSLRTINYSTGVSYTWTKWPIQPPVPASTPMAFAGKAPVFAASVSDTSGNWWQPRSILAGNTTDLGSLVPIIVPLFGTYLPVGGSGGWSGDTATSTIAAFAWS